MPNFNSTASQILNGTANFLNGVSNAARDVVANPLADLANIGLKTNPYVAAANLATKGKVNKAIDTVTSAAKGEQPNSLQKQPNDPTSIAQAVGEGLTRGVDQAIGVLSLNELAKQLPKAAQAGWKTILNKVKDAKSKSQQMKLAKEAREYINNNIDALNGTNRKLFTSEAPAYQQRAAARNAASQGAWDRNGSLQSIPTKGTPETYRGLYEPEPGQSSNIKNITEQFAEINNNKNLTAAEKDVFKQVAANDAIMNGDTAGVREYVNKGIDANKQIFNMDGSAASRAGVPYGGKNMKNVRAVQKEIQDLVKMSDKDFKKLMQDKSAASTAGYGDWRYNLGDDWIQNWNNPKEYQRMKEEIADNILNDAGLNYGVAEAYGNAIKSNAAKSSKRYRNWLKKNARDNYRTRASDQYRAQQEGLQNEATALGAANDKKEIMKAYNITDKEYEAAQKAAANEYIYVNDRGQTANVMGGGWPHGQYLTHGERYKWAEDAGYKLRHPTIEEYLAFEEEERLLSREAAEEAADIAREAGPAYDWSL